MDVGTGTGRSACGVWPRESRRVTAARRSWMAASEVDGGLSHGRRQPGQVVLVEGCGRCQADDGVRIERVGEHHALLEHGHEELRSDGRLGEVEADEQPASADLAYQPGTVLTEDFAREGLDAITQLG